MKLPKFESRQRVIIRIGLAIILVLSLGSWISAQAVERELSGRIDDELLAESTSIATVLDAIDAQFIEALADEFAVGERDWALILFDPSGERTTMPAGTTENPKPLPDVLDVELSELRGRAGEPFTVDDVDGGDDSYRALTVALDNGGVAVLAQSFDSVNAVLRIIKKTFFIGLVILVIALGTLVWAISRQALKPLEDVVETAHLIGAGSLNTRVEVNSTAPDVERLAEALNSMLARLQTAFDKKERSEARLRQFASDASHELRTPLAAILGYAELYEEQMARSPERVDIAMRRISAEATRMRSLVEDLLLLARLDEGRKLAQDAVDVVAVASDAVNAIQMVDGDHTITLRPAETPVEIVGDGLALREVIDNLLTNVITHTPAGTAATVSVSTGKRYIDGEERSGALITVADDGPGIGDEHAEKVFDRFYRAEQARSRPGGSGLGLAIADELVRAHGGTIDLATGPGEGASFVIWIPTSTVVPSAVNG